MRTAHSPDPVLEVEPRAELDATGPDPPPRDVLQLIPGDVRAKARWLYGSDGWKQVLKAAVTDGTGAMVLYRLMQQSTHYKIAPLAMLFNKLNVILGSCVIGRGAEFGPEFVLIHGMGVVINGSVRGGAGVLIEHQVTLGAEGRLSPQIGNGVFIGAGAKVLGAVKVGDGARIGANAVVVKDVPAHATAVGVPAKIVRVRTGNTTSPRGDSPRSDSPRGDSPRSDSPRDDN
jgi:serine O-acetyltransferase